MCASFLTLYDMSQSRRKTSTGSKLSHTGALQRRQSIPHGGPTFNACWSLVLALSVSVQEINQAHPHMRGTSTQSYPCTYQQCEWGVARRFVFVIFGFLISYLKLIDKSSMRMQSLSPRAKLTWEMSLHFEHTIICLMWKHILGGAASIWNQL